MKDKITILVKRIGQSPSVELIENDFRAMQKIVDGNIEIPYNPDLPKGVQLVCNEEGKFSDEPKPNIYWGDSDVIYGNIFFTSHNEDGEAISLTDEQIEQAKKFVEENDASNYNGSAEILAAENTKVIPFNSFEQFLESVLNYGGDEDDFEM